jgi:hypothetical protein
VFDQTITFETKKEDDGDGGGEPAQEEDEEAEINYDLYWTEKDYTLRKPLPKYEMLKSIETMCIAAGNSKPNLKAYVLCSGILYGNGEDIFYNLFR